MENPRIARMEFDRAHVSRRRRRHRNDEASEHVTAIRREGVGLRELQDQIGRAQLPAVGPLRNRRLISRIPLESAFIDPLLNGLNLLLAQSTFIFVGKPSITALREPWR